MPGRAPLLPGSGRSCHDGAMSGPGQPAGEPYDWYRRGCALLEAGEATAASELLAHVVAVDATSRAGWESLARARFDSRQFQRAAEAFGQLIDMAPDDDYAHFGLGLSHWRLGDLPSAAEHLALACAMRPDRDEYGRALGQVRATLRARRGVDGVPTWPPSGGGSAGLPMNNEASGPVTAAPHDGVGAESAAPPAPAPPDGEER